MPVASVRAGFRDGQLSALWPAGPWTLTERGPASSAICSSRDGATRELGCHRHRRRARRDRRRRRCSRARESAWRSSRKSEFPRRKVCGEYISATTWPILAELGVADRLAARAGPPVTRVGLFARDVSVEAPMPAPLAVAAWGRAVGREILDPRSSMRRAARAST
jgi:hypothetical protein